MCESDKTLYQCWPAPLYSLARRAGDESLPQDIPYLALRVSCDEIRRDLPLVERANLAIEAFGKLERSQFRAFRPDGMIPSMQAELREKMKGLIGFEVDVGPLGLGVIDAIEQEFKRILSPVGGMRGLSPLERAREFLNEPGLMDLAFAFACGRGVRMFRGNAQNGVGFEQ